MSKSNQAGGATMARAKGQKGRKAGAKKAGEAALPAPAALLAYPLAAVGDIHGQALLLDALLGKLQARKDWGGLTLVFLGDFCDRGPDSRGVLDRVVALAAAGRAVAVGGNHDLALVRAAGLDGRRPCPLWRRRYLEHYDCAPTFRSYLGRGPRQAALSSHAAAEREMAALAAAMPQAHRDFLAALPWGLEAAGHLFVHCGLSRAVALPAAEQARRLLAGRWEASSFRPGPLARAGSFGGGPAPGDYPAWLGADRDASGNPLPLFGKVQVTGHVRVERPQADAVRIRIDTTGGREGPLTAAVLASPSARPAFVQAAPPKPARPAWGGEPGDADEPPRRAAWRPWREAWRGW